MLIIQYVCVKLSKEWHLKVRQDIVLLTPYILHIRMLPAFFSKLFYLNPIDSDNKDDNVK